MQHVPLKAVHGYNVHLDECPLRERCIGYCSTAESTRLRVMTADYALEFEAQLLTYRLPDAVLASNEGRACYTFSITTPALELYTSIVIYISAKSGCFPSCLD